MPHQERNVFAATAAASAPGFLDAQTRSFFFEESQLTFAGSLLDAILHVCYNKTLTGIKNDDF